MSFGRKLNSDELGEKGESIFRALCADAKLVCNKSERDRTGWDFIVEFPFSPLTGETTLDRRSAPVSCIFQHKTVWKSSNRIKLLLSSVERLAKDLKPSFIYVVRINDDLSVADAYLIHLMGESLSTILRRLRKEEKQGKRDKINKLHLSLEISKLGKMIEPTGEALRAELEEICGVDLHDYAKRKQTQLANLGYDSGRFKMRMTIHATDQRELVDTFLGLRENVKVTNIETSEARFGIDLPAQPTSPLGGSLTLAPKPSDACIITYRRERLGHSALFNGTIVFLSAPVLEKGDIAALIRTEFFYMRFGESKLEFNSASDIFTKVRASVANWDSYFELCLGLGMSKGEIEIKPERATLALKLPLEGKNFIGIDAKLYGYFSEVTKALQRVLGVIGIRDSLSVSFVELQKIASTMRLINALLDHSIDEAGVLNFLSDMPENVDIGAMRSAILAYVISLNTGNVTIGFSAKADMRASRAGDEVEWKSVKLTSFDLRRLDGSNDKFQSYVSEMQAEIGASGSITHIID